MGDVRSSPSYLATAVFAAWGLVALGGLRKLRTDAS